MKTLLLMCFAFLCSPIMANEAYWYGTITFNKDFKESTTTTFKPGESYYPGTQLDSIKKSWFGEMRFLPEKKVVVSARFNAETILDRKTTTHGPCPWADGNFEEHDFEYSETKINFSNSWETSGDIKINVEDDGSYSTDKTATGGMSLPEATELYTRREFYVGCRSNPLTVDEQSVALPGEMEAVGLEITGKAKPDAETLCLLCMYCIVFIRAFKHPQICQMAGIRFSGCEYVLDCLSDPAVCRIPVQVAGGGSFDISCK